MGVMQVVVVILTRSAKVKDPPPPTSGAWPAAGLQLEKFKSWPSVLKNMALGPPMKNRFLKWPSAAD